MAEKRFLFANISYCYDGNVGGHFRYVKENNSAGEAYNFKSLQVEGENICWGFFEPGFTKGGYDKGGKQRRVAIERIDSSARGCPFVDDVTVIWCAYVDALKRSSVIGWYNDARVYRNIITFPLDEFPGRGLPNFGYIHNVEAPAKNCVLLPYSEIISEKWLSPRKNLDGIGFGQSNMWYAKEPAAQSFVREILNKIECYTGENRVN